MGAGQSTLDLLGAPSDEAPSTTYSGSPTTAPAVGHYTTKGVLELLENENAKPRTSVVPPMSQGKAAAVSAENGLLYGWLPEVNAVSSASGLPNWLGPARFPVGAARLLGEEFLTPEGREGRAGEAGLTYFKTKKEEKNTLAGATEQWPATATAADALGTTLSPMTRIRAASVAGRMAEGAVKNAIGGGLRGASDDQGAPGAITGAVVAGALGAPIGALGPSLRVPPVTTPAVEANTRLGAGAPVGLMTDNSALARMYQGAREIPLVGRYFDHPVQQALGVMENTANDISTRMGPMIDPASKSAVGYGLKSGMADTLKFNADKANAEFDNLRGMIRPNQLVRSPQSVINQLDDMIDRRVDRGQDATLTGYLADANNLLRRPQGATFEGLREARSVIGKAITWDSINNGGVGEADLRTTQRALTDAMENHIRTTARGNPQRAVEAWESANFAHSQRMEENEDLNKLIRTGSAEALTDKALKWANVRGGDYDSLRHLHSAVSDQDWSNLGSHATFQMGRNQTGEWSANVFRTRYNNMSPEARNELFGANTPVRRALDDIATLSQRFSQVGQLENRSHSGGALMTGGAVGGLLSGDVVSHVINHWDKVLGVGAAAFLLTRPATAESMARAARIYAAVTDSPRMIGTRALSAANQDLAAKIGKATGINIPPSALMPDTSPTPAK